MPIERLPSQYRDNTQGRGLVGVGTVLGRALGEALMQRLRLLPLPLPAQTTAAELPREH